MVPRVGPEKGEVAKHDESLDEELSQEEVEKGRQTLIECRQLEELYPCGDGKPHFDAHPVDRQPVLHHPVVKQSADRVVILRLIVSYHDLPVPGLLCHLWGE